MSGASCHLPPQRSPRHDPTPVVGRSKPRSAVSRYKRKRSEPRAAAGEPTDGPRVRARAALKANPDASLTAVAKVAGVSRGTVLNARDDMAAEARKAARKEARNSRETSKAAKPTAHGPKRVSDVEEAAAKARVDEHSLEQARGDLGVLVSRGNTGVQAVTWSLPAP